MKTFVLNLRYFTYWVSKVQSGGLGGVGNSLLGKFTFGLLLLPLWLPLLYFISFFLLRVTHTPFFFTNFSASLIFQAIVEVSLVLYVFLRARESGYAPFLGLTHVLWLFLALLLGITSFLSQDWSFSFFGDTRRGDGLIFVFHVGLYAFLLSWVLQTRQRLELSLMAGLAAGTVTLFFLSLVVGLTAPLELVAWTQTAGSVLGNQNLFAHYVLLLALFNAYFLITKPRPWNVFFLFLLLFAIGVTRSSTGIFLGALLGLVCVLFYSRKLFAGALGLGVGALLLYALNFQIHPFLQKEIASLSVRWDLWRDVLETVLKERPILGFGWGNEALLRSSASQELMSSARFSGFVVFDRAHNFILEFLSAAGIAGVFALFAFWGRVLLSSLGCFRAGRGRIWGFFFLAFSMHLAFLLFNFDGNMSYILSALLLAGYMLLEREESVRLQVPRFIVLPVSIGVVLLSLFAAWEFSVKPLYAYSLVREAHYLLAVADARQDEAPSRLRRAQEILQPYDTILLEAASAYELVPRRLVLSQEEKRRVADETLRIYRDLAVKHPHVALYRYRLAMAEKRFSGSRQSLPELQEAVRLAPETALFRFGLYQAYLELGDVSSAQQQESKLFAEGPYRSAENFYDVLSRLPSLGVLEANEAIGSVTQTYRPDLAEWRLLEGLYQERFGSEQLLLLYSDLLEATSTQVSLYALAIHLAQEMEMRDTAQAYLFKARSAMPEEAVRDVLSDLLELSW